MTKYTMKLKTKLNNDIKMYFSHLTTIDEDMILSFEGVARLVMLDRYAQKDLSLKSLGIGDLVLTIVKDDPKFPARGVGYVYNIEEDFVEIKLEEEYLNLLSLDNHHGIIKRKMSEVDKPLEIYYEQIAKRVSSHLGEGEDRLICDEFYHELKSLNLVPAGRILYGAGSNSKVTYFNCFVMPFIHDSRSGIARHREQVMEIMSRGGGVGTNGSTLRPKNSLARGVNGKSSGAISWLNDLSQLTHLVEQGGSRRGAQMIMLAIWHPDIIEFIISKMQNPRILRFLIEHIQDETIQKAAKAKLKYIPLSDNEQEVYTSILKFSEVSRNMFSKSVIYEAEKKLSEDGQYEVNNPEFLSGANISVAITNDFMEAVENDLDYPLQFPDIDHYNEEEKRIYNEEWDKIGDVRLWAKMGHKVKTYKTIKAKELWNLINICATYSAEPGIFFIDNANQMTNAYGYNQKVICTNPCGEQPLAAYSVCNLAAINLSNMVNRSKKKIDYVKLEKTIQVAVRMQDNVIDKTSYFLEENKSQALGERRIGLGVMGLHDMLIWCNKRYGSKDGNKLVEELFNFIAIKAYETSIELAKEKGSFPFLKDDKAKERLVESGFIKKMPKYIKERILAHGIRNSHLLTIAPTGSTGTMIGISTGLEPYFAFKYYRSGRLGKYIEVSAQIVAEFLKANPEYDEEQLPDFFVSAMELAAEEHAEVQCIIQKWVDSSISKTVNAPKNYTVEDVEKLYMYLYKNGAKGGTVYVDGSRDAQVLTLKKEDKKIVQTSIEDLEPLHIARASINKGDSLLRSDRQDREIGVEEGDLCPICREGIVKKIGGCNTCNNCNAQLKCDL